MAWRCMDSEFTTLCTPDVLVDLVGSVFIIIFFIPLCENQTVPISAQLSGFHVLLDEILTKPKGSM